LPYIGFTLGFELFVAWCANFNHRSSDAARPRDLRLR
jgi:hypothetical protein